jgi:tRNA dimethylallyltransferase
MGHDPSRFDRSAASVDAGTAGPPPDRHTCPETAIVPCARDGGGPVDAPETAPDAPVLDADCWFLSGPTASGKSDLGIDLAGRLGADIVSVDSMAVYRGLDVGTAKPTAAQRAAIRHHLLDVVAPSEPYSVARWLADAARAVADCRARGRQILFVGGTPLYLRALREGLARLPAADPAFRASLEAEAARDGTAALHRRLAAADPVAAARIHQGDLRRIVRALEVAAATGRPLSSHFQPQANPWFDGRLMIVDLPRALLRRRIDDRVERMFAAGLVEETQAALVGAGLGPTALQAAGYAEAVALLAGAIDRAEAVRRTQARTRQLAKRQLTWLRGFPRAVWLTA